jgi:hypothetical protein
MGVWVWGLPGLRAAAEGVGGEESKRFFFEKRKQKTFMTLLPVRRIDHPPRCIKWIKVFCFFF